MRRLVLLGLVAVTAGCASFLPLPLNPLQIMLKQFPEDVADVGSTSRSYTIKGDTFAYPDVGFSINRPESQDWQFVPGNSSVTVQLKDGLTGTEPRPGLVVQLIPLKPGTDVEAAKLADLDNLLKANASVETVPRFVSGYLADAWTFIAPDPATKLSAEHLRLYVELPGVLAVIEAVAEPNTFAQLAPQFASMIATMVLPPVPAGSTPVPAPPLSPLLAPTVKGLAYTDTATNVTFTAADESWSFGLDGLKPALRKGGVSKGIDPVPQIALTAIAAKGVDLTKAIQAELDNDAAAKLPVKLTKRVIDGNQGLEIDFDKPDVLGKTLSVEHVYVQNSQAIAILEATAIKTDFPTVSADFSKMVDALKLPAASPVPVPDFAASGAVAAATPAPGATAQPAASGAATATGAAKP